MGMLKLFFSFSKREHSKRIEFASWLGPCLDFITKTCLYNFDPLKPHSKTGVYRGMYYFLISAKNIDSGYLLEPPRRGGSNENPQCMF